MQRKEVRDMAARSEERRWLNRIESGWIAAKNAAPSVVAHVVNPAVGAGVQAFKIYDDWKDQMAYISQRYKDQPVRRRGFRLLATGGSVTRGALPVVGFLTLGLPGAVAGSVVSGVYEEYKHHQRLKHAGQLGLRENDFDKRLIRGVRGAVSGFRRRAA